MSKIAKRNYVKKNMDRQHKPKTHSSKKDYNREWKKNFDMYNVRYIMKPMLEEDEDVLE